MEPICLQVGSFELNQAELLAYSHGSYLETGRELGTFGYSIRKKNKSKAQNPSKKNKKKGAESFKEKVKTGHSVPGKIDRRNRTKNV